VLDMSLLSHVRAFDATAGLITCQAGTPLQHVQHVTQQRGWELRVVPNTVEEHTVAGFVAGHVTGFGSLKHGALEHALHSVTLVTCEAEPRVLLLTDVNAMRRAVHR
jgi:FAD/FMN-containing dehydrogenase